MNQKWAEMRAELVSRRNRIKRERRKLLKAGEDVPYNFSKEREDEITKYIKECDRITKGGDA